MLWLQRLQGICVTSALGVMKLVSLMCTFELKSIRFVPEEHRKCPAGFDSNCVAQGLGCELGLS